MADLDMSPEPEPVVPPPAKRPPLPTGFTPPQDEYLGLDKGTIRYAQPDIVVHRNAWKSAEGHLMKVFRELMEMECTSTMNPMPMIYPKDVQHHQSVIDFASALFRDARVAAEGVCAMLEATEKRFEKARQQIAANSATLGREVAR